jgi:preprotein translocase subunit SecF
MALAAMAALVHDLIVTMGVYSLVGFEVTPSTIIALLTILGFSLYDTVVVFDRVRENTAGMGTASRRTYAEATNDALNETLVRSLNTSLIALIPVASLLFVGAGLLGAGTLKDLALAQFVGIASGTYSSLFFATPILVDLKKNEPVVKALEQRVARARTSASRKSEAGAAGATGAVVEAPTGVEGRSMRLRKASRPVPGSAGFGAGPPSDAVPSEAPPPDDIEADVSSPDDFDDATGAPPVRTGGLASAAAGAGTARERPRQGPPGGTPRPVGRKNTRRGGQSGRKRR